MNIALRTIVSFWFLFVYCVNLILIVLYFSGFNVLILFLQIPLCRYENF